MTDEGQEARLRTGLVRHGMDEDSADAVVHALSDINDSMAKIVDQLLPALLEAIDQTDREFRVKLWDIREEFRHVDYHIHDAGLPDL